MQTTVLSCLNDEEIIEFAGTRESLTDLEIELVQRLTIAVDMITEQR